MTWPETFMGQSAFDKIPEEKYTTNLQAIGTTGNDIIIYPNPSK